MPAARYPDTDPRRLAALRALQILDTKREAAFDDRAWLAAALMDTPMAAISLIDEDRQWFKSTVGFTALETPRDIAICGYTILGAEPLVIEDATMDERVSDNERVTSAPCLRFYAGVPLRTADRHNIGALCTMDTRPRIVTRSQITMLETLAKSVLRTIEERSTADQAAARRMTGRD
jgi:GAF domain-containing protein